MTKKAKIIYGKNGEFASEVKVKGSCNIYSSNTGYNKYADGNRYFIACDNNSVLTDCKEIVIYAPKDRMEELDKAKIVISGVKITEFTLIDSIRNFYHNYMTQEELQEIAATQDLIGNNKKKASDALAKGMRLQRYDIMGDLVEIDGIKPIEIKDGVAVYELLLGS